MTSDFFYNLQGKTAVITGATRGLGKILADYFWRSGAHIILVARDQAKLNSVINHLGDKTSKNQTALAFTLDLAQASHVEKFAAELVQAYKVNILVNNAALQGPIGPVWENDQQKWQETLQVNLLSPITLCRAVMPSMIKHQAGKIINLSGGGAAAARENFSAYAVSKAGLVRFSETLAEEVKPWNVSVNCLAPGLMNTDMVKEMLAAGEEKMGTKEYTQIINKMNSATDDVIKRAAELCLFLASDQSNGITGKLISAQWDPWQELHHYLDDLQQTDIYTLRRIVPKDRHKTWGEV